MQFGTDGVRGRANSGTDRDVRARSRARRSPRARRIDRSGRWRQPHLDSDARGGVHRRLVVGGDRCRPSRSGADGRDRVRGRAIGRDGRRHVGIAQPVRRQRHQAVRGRGHQAADELEQQIELELAGLPAPAGEPGVVHGRRDPERLRGSPARRARWARPARAAGGGRRRQRSRLAHRRRRVRYVPARRWW